MKYFVRSVKYLVALVVLYVAIMAVMHLTGMSMLSVGDEWQILTHTPKGIGLMVAIVVLAAFYPMFGFVTRRVEGDIDWNRAQLLTAFEAQGYRLVTENDGELRFRAGAVRRVFLLFEDEVVVRQYGQWIELQGLRSQVVKVAYRAEGYIKNYNRNND